MIAFQALDPGAADAPFSSNVGIFCAAQSRITAI
jgi:hypothetical protein